jgi:hypothetical protein
VDSAGAADRHPAGAAAAAGPDRQAALLDAVLGGAAGGGLCPDPAQRAEGVADRPRLLAAVLEGFVVAFDAEVEGRGGGGRHGEAEVPLHEPEQVGERHSEQRPGPAQARLAQGEEQSRAGGGSDQDRDHQPPEVEADLAELVAGVLPHRATTSMTRTRSSARILATARSTPRQVGPGAQW